PRRQGRRSDEGADAGRRHRDRGHGRHREPADDPDPGRRQPRGVSDRLPRDADRPRAHLHGLVCPPRPEWRTRVTNDAVDWRRDLGAGTSVALVQAGTFRSDAGALFGPVPRILWDRWAATELDDENRL